MDQLPLLSKEVLEKMDINDANHHQLIAEAARQYSNGNILRL